MGTLSRGGLQCPYLVGDIYITTRSENPSNLWQGTTWEKVGSGRALMGADSSHGAGTTVNSGLPDIQGTHKLAWVDSSGGGVIIHPGSTTGAFYSWHESPAFWTGGGASDSSDAHRNWIGFKASNYNSIYGSSSIVQPPAFFCYFWKRLS